MYNLSLKFFNLPLRVFWWGWQPLCTQHPHMAWQQRPSPRSATPPTTAQWSQTPRSARRRHPAGALRGGVELPGLPRGQGGAAGTAAVAARVACLRRCCKAGGPAPARLAARRARPASRGSGAVVCGPEAPRLR
ncbi:unnamed protein product [Prorocentrum cordatum]|uniref:Uncharacterized protein n=1 Tax=Prorocentrum cordatum TaxID=2364126 RepID=A0ABN9VQ03_9DINO|nr:unnamed protein product [Polarella glacialis]